MWGRKETGRENLSRDCRSPSGVETKFKGAFYDVLICPSHVPELSVVEVTEEGLAVGAAVSLTQLAAKLEELHNTLPGKTAVM